jgi:hypothetical protein
VNLGRRNRGRVPGRNVGAGAVLALCMGSAPDDGYIIRAPPKPESDSFSKYMKYVDISDMKGRMRLHGSQTVRGHLRARAVAAAQGLVFAETRATGPHPQRLSSQGRYPLETFWPYLSGNPSSNRQAAQRSEAKKTGMPSCKLDSSSNPSQEEQNSNGG